MKQPTTTSYVILAHLAVRPWSAYELAGQITRGLDLVWPRARSAIYEEPKVLVAHGLARARVETAGRRSRTVYAITAKGRRALAEWFATEPAPPELESEGLIRVFFADQGDPDDLLATLRGLAQFGARLEARLAAQIEGYVERGEPFPERFHVIALGSRFLVEYALLVRRWARWAEAEAAGWSTAGAEPAARGRELLLETLARLRARRRGHAGGGPGSCRAGEGRHRASPTMTP